MSRLLITGACGFTGIHLQKFLRDNFSGEIIPVDLILPESKGGIQIDLLNRSEVFSLLKNTRPDLIIHLAGISRSENYEDIYKSNVFTTINLLDSVVQNELPGTRILLISSSAVYGNSLTVKVAEPAPLNPVNHYGNSKLLVEKIAQQYIARDKLKIVLVRPFNLFGPGQCETFIVPAFLTQLIRIKNGLQDPVISVGDLSGKRDFVYINDAIRAYWQVLTNGEIGEIYNVGSGHAISIQTVLETLLRFTGIDCEIRTDSRRVQRYQIQHIFADTSKIKSLGWQSTTTFEDAINNIINESVRAHH